MQELEMRLGITVFQRTSAHNDYYPLNQWYLSLLHGDTGEWCDDLDVTWNTDGMFNLHLRNGISRDISLYPNVADITLEDFGDFLWLYNTVLGKDPDYENALHNFRAKCRHFAYLLGSREVLYLGDDRLGEMIDDERLTCQRILKEMKAAGSNIWNIATSHWIRKEATEDYYNTLFTDDFSDLPPVVALDARV